MCPSVLNFGLIGCGRIGKMHADNIARHPKARLAMTFDVNAQICNTTAMRHKAEAARSADALLKAQNIDAVVVASATETHADLIEKAVDHGKPILCEKPIDLCLSRVEACSKAIRGKNVPVQIGFNRRFDPGHRALRDALQQGTIGQLHQVVITSRDPHMPPRAYYETAGGLFRDMTIHDFDLARFMLSEEPVEVFASAERLIDPNLMRELNDFDTAMIILRTQSGKQCHINNSRTAVYGYDQRVEVLGETGMLISDNRKPHEMRAYSATSSEAGPPYLHFFIERYQDSFMAELSAFIEAVQSNRPPEVGFNDGYRALLIAEAAYRSLKEKRAVPIDARP